MDRNSNTLRIKLGLNRYSPKTGRLNKHRYYGSGRLTTRSMTQSLNDNARQTMEDLNELARLAEKQQESILRLENSVECLSIRKEIQKC